MCVRNYEAGDRDLCLVVLDSNVPRFFAPQERPEFAAFLDALPGRYFVMQTGTDLIACGGYAPKENGRVALCWGMVRRDHHARGIGRRLLEYRLDHIRRDGSIVRVNLSTYIRLLSEIRLSCRSDHSGWLCSRARSLGNEPISGRT